MEYVEGVGVAPYPSLTVQRRDDRSRSASQAGSWLMGMTYHWTNGLTRLQCEATPLFWPMLAQATSSNFLMIGKNDSVATFGGFGGTIGKPYLCSPLWHPILFSPCWDDHSPWSKILIPPYICNRHRPSPCKSRRHQSRKIQADYN